MNELLNWRIEDPSVPTTEPSFKRNPACLAIRVAGVAEAASAASRSSIKTQSTTSGLGMDVTDSSRSNSMVRGCMAEPEVTILLY